MLFETIFKNKYQRTFEENRFMLWLWLFIYYIKSTFYILYDNFNINFEGYYKKFGNEWNSITKKWNTKLNILDNVKYKNHFNPLIVRYKILGWVL